jgi:hypothetical protein
MGLFGTQATNTTMAFQMSNIVEKGNIKRPTLYIGQRTDEDGNFFDTRNVPPEEKNPFVLDKG